MDIRDIKRSNSTDGKTTDPDALRLPKSNAYPAQPSHRGQVLMDNRHALIVKCKVTQVPGTCERDSANAVEGDCFGAR